MGNLPTWGISFSASKSGGMRLSETGVADSQSSPTLILQTPGAKIKALLVITRSDFKIG